MCAMMPILRTRSMGVWRAIRLRIYSVLPAIMGEGPIRLRHSMGIFAFFYRPATIRARLQNLIGPPLPHRLLTASARRSPQPAHRQRRSPKRPHLDRHLVVGAAYASRTNFNRGPHIVERTLENDQPILLGAFRHKIESAVEDLLGTRLLAAFHHHVDELRHRAIMEFWIRDSLPDTGLAFARHDGLLRLL